jgi:hypothetical protein
MAIYCCILTRSGVCNKCAETDDRMQRRKDKCRKSYIVKYENWETPVASAGEIYYLPPWPFI